MRLLLRVHATTISPLATAMRSGNVVRHQTSYRAHGYANSSKLSPSSSGSSHHNRYTSSGGGTRGPSSLTPQQRPLAGTTSVTPSHVAALATAEQRRNAVVDTTTSRPTFWSQSVKSVTTATLKHQHLFHRAEDKKSRFLVRSRIREDGVVSNFYPLSFELERVGTESGGVPPAPASPGAFVYIYEIYVTRVVPTKGAIRDVTTVTARGGRSAQAVTRSGSGTTSVMSAKERESPVERRVPPGRAWRAVERYLRHTFSGVAAESLPPLVQLANSIYAAAPLPAAALRLPSTYFDLGWKTAELRLVRRCPYTSLPPSELQMLINKIVPAVARAAHRGQKQNASSVEVVREKTGKLVCTMQGVSAGGLRIYKGIVVQAMFVDDSAADAYDGAPVAPPASSNLGREASTGGPSSVGDVPCPVTTRHLGDTPVGNVETGASVLPFQVVSFLRVFAYRGVPAESYRIRDASGVFLASCWGPAQPRALRIGGVYTASAMRIREFPERGNARLIEFPSGAVFTPTALPSRDDTPAPTAAHAEGPRAAIGGSAAGRVLPGRVCLKIDTKGTIASEASLWEEVLQHFGPGPYDELAQQRISKSVHGMPVVISYSLRQGIVRDVRFDSGVLLCTPTTAFNQEDGDGRPSEEAPSPSAAVVVASAPDTAIHSHHVFLREPRLLPLIPHFDPRQPCAVLADHTIVPLQVLHCCFDPRLRSWQDIAVSALSLMPQQRAELLREMHALLADGLRRWGIVLSAHPLSTKTLSLLPAPMKCVVPSAPFQTTNGAKGAAAASREVFPTTVVVIGVAGPRCTADQSRRIALTAHHLAKYFRTRLVEIVTEESAAVQFMHEQLMCIPAASNEPSSSAAAVLRDPNASVVVVTNEVLTRATRWLKVECMCRGVHCIAVPPSSSPNKLALQASQVRRQIMAQFERNPLRGINLREEVPVLGGRHVFFIGVDACHTNTHSLGTIVGILSTPAGNHLLSHFWRHDARGREAQHVTEHFRGLLRRAIEQVGRVDEVVVFQDGDVFSELVGMKEELASQVRGCGLTFMCLHKRCNTRFMHTSSSTTTSARGGTGGGTGSPTTISSAESKGETCKAGNDYHNIVKGVLVPALTPIPLDYPLAAPSFFLQTHECAMSTARAVQYTVHHVSPTLDVADVQQMANVMANVMAPQATKLPMSTRCAHRLADQAERLLDAVPQFTAEMIPYPLCNRLWFM